MAFTQTDLDEITAAIVALGKGQRRVSATINGKSVTWGQANLAELKQLRADIGDELSQAAGTASNFAYIQTSKGF